MSSIGCGSPWTTRPSSWWALPQEEPFSHRTGELWQSESTLRSLGRLPSSGRGTVVSEGAAPIAAVSRGIAISNVGVSGWDLQSFNESDPLEVALAAGLRESAAAHVASSTAAAYRGPWAHFVSWCSSLAAPRCSLPDEEITLALYLQSMVERSSTFAAVKSASAAIAFFHKVNMYNHLPTQPPAVSMWRETATRKFGLTPKGRKKPFQWTQMVSFALAYRVHNQGYCHLVVASMAVVMFGGMCMYNDVSRFRWRSVTIEPDGRSFHLSFEKRKNG